MHPKLQHIVEFLSDTEQEYYNQVCDNQLRFIFVGDKFCDLLNMPREAVINKNLRELSSPLSILSDKYLALHLPLLQGVVNKVEYVTFIQHEKQMFIARNTVSSIKDGDVVIGIYIQTKMLNYINNLPKLKKYVTKLNSNNYSVIPVSELTKPQYDDLDEFTEVVLFLILLGKYDKEIAEFCSVIFGKDYTVFAISKFVTRKLFIKFNVDSRNQLINKVLFLNVLNKIPPIIFHNPELYDLLFNSQLTK